jgi:hypothetical protein
MSCCSGALLHTRVLAGHAASSTAACRLATCVSSAALRMFTLVSGLSADFCVLNSIVLCPHPS